MTLIHVQQENKQHKLTAGEKLAAPLGHTHGDSQQGSTCREHHTERLKKHSQNSMIKLCGVKLGAHEPHSPKSVWQVPILNKYCTNIPTWLKSMATVVTKHTLDTPVTTWRTHNAPWQTHPQTSIINSYSHGNVHALLSLESHCKQPSTAMAPKQGTLMPLRIWPSTMTFQKPCIAWNFHTKNASQKLTSHSGFRKKITHRNTAGAHTPIKTRKNLS